MAVSFSETLHRGYTQVMTIDGPMIADERSAFQHIQIFDTPANGRVLVLDGIVQLTDRDEASYSEMLAHVPLMECEAPARVLIVGGGDGAIAEEVLKHEGIASVDLVDIDGRVVELSKEHFAHVSGAAFADPRLKVHIEDAFAFLKAAEVAGRYDVIIADRPDPVGPAEVLFADAFYTALRAALAPTGFAVFQTGAPFYQGSELTDTKRQLEKIFEASGVYLTVTPTYIGGFMALTWASRGARLGKADPARLAERFTASRLVTDYYSPAMHQAAFTLPPAIMRLLPRCGAHSNFPKSRNGL